MDFKDMDKKDKIKLGLAGVGLVIGLTVLGWYLLRDPLSTNKNDAPLTPETPPGAPTGGPRTAPPGEAAPAGTP